MFFLWVIPKDHYEQKKIGVSEKELAGGIFFKGLGLSVAPKPKCGITQPSQRIAFYNVLTSLNSSSSTTISLVALVGFQGSGRENEYYFSNEVELQNEDVLKDTNEPENEYDLKNEDAPQTEDNLKKRQAKKKDNFKHEDELGNEDIKKTSKMKTTPNHMAQAYWMFIFLFYYRLNGTIANTIRLCHNTGVEKVS